MLDGDPHALAKFFIHADQPLAAVRRRLYLRAPTATTCRYDMARACDGAGWRSAWHATRERGFDGARLNPITESGKAAARKQDERARWSAVVPLALEKRLFLNASCRCLLVPLLGKSAVISTNGSLQNDSGPPQGPAGASGAS